MLSKLPATIKSILYASTQWRKVSPLTVSANSISQTPILAVCDPMTWHNLSSYHTAVAVTSTNWKLAFANSQKYKFFFCEAAWTGHMGSPWRAQVYKDGRVFHENRKKLLHIIEHCNREKIPTVFWAKEDPAYFQNEIYNFTDTALKFDYILTTAEECIKKYQALGHNNVHLWPFAFSTEIFYPPNNEADERENVAVFAGSWFSDHPQRCVELAGIFDMVLENDISLRIYDRNMLDGHSAKSFPKKYQHYVQNSVQYETLGETYRKVLYAININTVCDSETMFARRVYEAMACGAIVISNHSIGLRKQFDSSIWFLGEDFDHCDMHKIRQHNIDYVFANHTWQQRMEQLFQIIGCND